MLMPVAPEEELLFRLVQSVGGSKTANSRIKEITKEGPDWDKVLTLTMSHGLVSHLYTAVNDQKNLVPKEIQTTLRNLHHKNITKNLQYSQYLHDLLEVFEENNVRVIPYKGPALAEYAYGGLDNRWFGDLDLLVIKEDVARAKEILQARGYKITNDCGIPLKKLIDESFFRWEGELKFEGRDKKPEIELRPEFTGVESNFVIIEEIWKRRTPLKVANKTLNALSPEDRALLVLTHGTKHGWSRLSWVCDVVMLLRKDIAWEKVLFRAKEYGWKTGVLLGLAVTAEVANVKLPRRINSEIKASIRARLGGLYLPTLVQTNPDGDPVSFYPWTIIVFLNETPEEIFREFVDHLITPRKADYNLISLPPRLYLLYYIFRPVKFASKLAKKSIKKLY